MIDKIKSILGSIRFWQIVLAFGVEIIAFYGYIPLEVARSIESLLGVSVVIGTIDKFSK